MINRNLISKPLRVKDTITATVNGNFTFRMSQASSIESNPISKDALADILSVKLSNESFSSGVKYQIMGNRGKITRPNTLHNYVPKVKPDHIIPTARFTQDPNESPKMTSNSKKITSIHLLQSKERRSNETLV